MVSVCAPLDGTVPLGTEPKFRDILKFDETRQMMSDDCSMGTLVENARSLFMRAASSTRTAFHDFFRDMSTHPLSIDMDEVAREWEAAKLNVDSVVGFFMRCLAVAFDDADLARAGRLFQKANLAHKVRDDPEKREAAFKALDVEIRRLLCTFQLLPNVDRDGFRRYAEALSRRDYVEAERFLHEFFDTPLASTGVHLPRQFAALHLSMLHLYFDQRIQASHCAREALNKAESTPNKHGLTAAISTLLRILNTREKYSPFESMMYTHAIESQSFNKANHLRIRTAIRQSYTTLQESSLIPAMKPLRTASAKFWENAAASAQSPPHSTSSSSHAPRTLSLPSKSKSAQQSTERTEFGQSRAALTNHGCAAVAANSRAILRRLDYPGDIDSSRNYENATSFHHAISGTFMASPPSAPDGGSPQEQKTPTGVPHSSSTVLSTSSSVIDETSRLWRSARVACRAYCRDTKSDGPDISMVLQRLHKLRSFLEKHPPPKLSPAALLDGSQPTDALHDARRFVYYSLARFYDVAGNTRLRNRAAKAFSSLTAQ